MAIKITESFDFAHRGVEIEHFAAGRVVDEPSDELRECAVSNGWAKELPEPGAPENKDAARLPREKKAK